MSSFQTMAYKRDLKRYATRRFGQLMGAHNSVRAPRARLAFRLFKRVKDSPGRWANPMFLRQRDRFLAV
jgi:hypothetical protein